jgi:hypothetical protein
VPGRYVEYFVDENWLEHQRRLERFTAFDAGLREQRLAFHIGSEPPVLRRYVADSATRKALHAAVKQRWPRGTESPACMILPTIPPSDS